MLHERTVRTAVLFAISCLSCVSVLHAAAAGTLQWQTNLEEAKRLASQTNRLVLVHFWSPTCKPCQELEHNVFSQPQVQQFIDARFVPIKINADDAPTTTKRYGIRTLPTDLILTPGAQIVGRLGCPLAADAYMQQLLVASSAPAPAAAPSAGFAANTIAPSAPVVSATTPYSPPAPAIQQPTGFSPAIAMPPASAPAPSYTAAPTYTAQPGYGSTPATSPSPNPATIASTPAANPAPRIGYSGQWSAPKSNAAVEQAYSDNRYSEFFQRYSTATNAPAQTAPTNNYASASAPQASYPPATLAPSSSNYASQNSTTGSSGYGSPGPQLSMPNNFASSAPAASAAPTDSVARSLGFDGYSPVALVEQGKWQLGDRRYGAVHRGRTYLFASADEQQRFLADPDRYSPTASGDDVVMALDYGQEVPGKRNFGLMYQNRMYLFSSEATQKTFMQNRERYAAQVMQAENLSRNSIR